MYAYNNPEIVAISNPKGVDAKILQLQTALSSLTWLQKVFGRAIIQVDENAQKKRDGSIVKKDIFFPEFLGNNNEPFNLMPNDNLRSYCFFYLRDAATFPDYVPGDNNIAVVQPVSLIVWANLKRLNPDRSNRWSEELKSDLLRKLAANYDFELTRAYETYRQVFSDFTVTDTYKQYLKPPFWAIRIDGNLTYNQFTENVCN